MNLVETKKHLPYIFALAIITSIFFVGFYNEKMPARDMTLAYLPHYETLKISAFEYHDFWPLWAPYGFSGDPFLMKPLPGLDNLAGIMVLIIPNTVIALKLHYVFLFLLSGIAMYCLMIYLKVKKEYAFIAALVYILNAHVSKLLVWGWGSTLAGYAVLPFAFLYGMKALKEEKIVLNSVIAGIIFAILLRFNQDMKVTIWFAILFSCYVLFSIVGSKARVKRGIIVSMIILVVFFGLSAQRVLSNLDYIKTSSRASLEWEQSSSRKLLYSGVLDRLIDPMFKGLPEFQKPKTGDHIGIIAFALVCYAIYSKKKDKRVLFFTFAALFSIFVATNTFGLYFILWKFLPLFKSLRYMDRSLFLFAFSCSVLVGIGAQELIEKAKNKKIVYISIISLIIINLGIFGYSHYSGNLDDWMSPKKAIENNHILQNISKQQGIFRIQTWETRGIDWGTDIYNVPLHLEHIYRYDGLWYPPYMNEYLSIAYNDPAKFWGILNLKYLTAKEPLNISNFQFVKKFDNCTACFPVEPLLSKAWGPYLYENKLFLPRAYVVSNSILVVGEPDPVNQAIYWLMLNENFHPSNTVIIRGRQSINDYTQDELARYSAILLTKGSVDGSSQFKLEGYAKSGGRLLPDIFNNKNTLSDSDVDLLLAGFKGNLQPIQDSEVIMQSFDKRRINLDNQKGFLVYSEKFSLYDGWKAMSETEEEELLNADAMVSSIYLDGDEKSIVFTYSPLPYKVGLIITIITMISLIVFYIYYISKKQSPKPTDETSG